PVKIGWLSVLLPDYRDTTEALVHKDLRLSFDGNRYCVPPRYVGRKLTVKADGSSVTIYDQHHEIVRYGRSWHRGQTLGAEAPVGLRSASRKSPLGLLSCWHQPRAILSLSEVRPLP